MQLTNGSSRLSSDENPAGQKFSSDFFSNDNPPCNTKTPRLGVPCDWSAWYSLPPPNWFKISRCRRTYPAAHTLPHVRSKHPITDSPSPPSHPHPGHHSPYFIQVPKPKPCLSPFSFTGESAP